MLLFLILLLIPAVTEAGILSTSVKEAFQNTLKRWNVRPASAADQRERWLRFQKSVVSVELMGRRGSLDSLNPFTVMNDAEYSVIEQNFGQSNHNFSLSLSDDTSAPQRRRRRDTLADENTYWTETVGLNTPKNQLGCGSCWSFPTTAVYEALTRNLSGEVVSFSEQYFVDCTFTYDGCSGGLANAGFTLTEDRQYLQTRDDYPYTGFYVECPVAADIETFTNNAMTKIWASSWYPIATTDESTLLPGLDFSPVAFPIQISSNFMSYSGGTIDDSSCVTDPIAHVMLLAAYTTDAFIVRNSYGESWGEGGYVYYERSSTNFFDCMLGNGYAVTAVERRELEYAYCNGQTLGTVSECEASCEAMNTGGETGWTMAIIPTLYHNTIVANKVNGDYPGVKSNDKFNYVWIGLSDLDKTFDWVWADGVTPFQYSNLTDYSVTGKYGMLNKNDGTWLMKNSLTYTARGMCSRFTTCFDISSSVSNGGVEYNDTSIALGTTATVTCVSGSNMTIASGESATLTCVGGNWDADLPSCSEPDDDGGDEDDECAPISVQFGTITPSQPVSDGTNITITCLEGFTLSGDSVLACEGGNFTGTVPTCSASGCPNVTVANGVVSGAEQPAQEGETLTVTCDEGYSLEGEAYLNCTDGDVFNTTIPECLQCNELSVDNGVITEASETEVMVACISNAYELIGSNSLTCERCLDDFTHDTVLCKSPSFDPATVPQCRLVPGVCPGGSYYTEDGCETCPENHWLPEGRSSPTGGCNKCPGARSAPAGSSSVHDCRYTLCTCKIVNNGRSKYKSSCNCL